MLGRRSVPSPKVSILFTSKSKRPHFLMPRAIRRCYTLVSGGNKIFFPSTTTFRRQSLPPLHFLLLSVNDDGKF